MLTKNAKCEIVDKVAEILGSALVSFLGLFLWTYNHGNQKT